MKEPNRSKGMSKEKKQLVLLGVLAVVLLAVVAIPRGGDAEEAPPPAAAAAASPPAAAAAPPAAPGVSPAAPAGAAVNPALSSATDDEDEGLLHSPFESFWAMAAPVETRVDDLPPPTVTLNGTVVSSRTPVAVVDGRNRFIGDSIQGWTLETIGPRAITLRSPSRNTVTITMPLLQGEGRRPPGDGR